MYDKYEIKRWITLYNEKSLLKLCNNDIAVKTIQDFVNNHEKFKHDERYRVFRTEDDQDGFNDASVLVVLGVLCAAGEKELYNIAFEKIS